MSAGKNSAETKREKNRNATASRPPGAALNNIKNAWNIFILMLMHRGFTHIQYACTHLLHVLPNDNDTNKMAYIFLNTKDQNSWILAETSFCRTVQFTARSGVAFVQMGDKHFNLCARKINAWRPFLLSACLRVLNERLCVVLGAYTCWTCWLTQHSRPHTLDRLFSPILVEVL